MLNFLKNLPQKPYHVRVQLLWICVAVSIFFVGWIWLGSLKKSLSLNVINPITETSQEEGEAASSIFGGVKNIFLSLKADVGNSLGRREDKENKLYPYYYQEDKEALRLPNE